MHIKQVILEGFKVYKERVEVEFTEKHNCVGARARAPTRAPHGRAPD